MLTRLVRIQLVIFTVLSVVGIALMAFVYVNLPTLLGIGRMTVTLQLPAGGGLYRFSNVTYRGVQIGRVTSTRLTDSGAEATLSLDRSPKIPADLKAEVRSISAVGEQYVDLRPLSASGPFLADGAVIPVQATSIPQPVGPMLDQVSNLIQSIPKDRLSSLVSETFDGFNGAGSDFRSLLDSLTTVSNDVNGVSQQARALIDDSRPLVESQAETADSIRAWAHSLAGVSATLAQNDPYLRTVLDNGPAFADDVSAVLEQVKPTLPVLLANLTSLGQILVTYNPGLEQLLVLLPGVIAAQQSFGLPQNNPYGIPLSDFTITVNDPPGCTVGFLPPSSWRNPQDLSVIDTPDGLYCKLPQDSPISVRGARNYPCMEHPGKRAPTVELCNDPGGYQPLAMRQHTTGPYPLDPNLVSQGVPLDDRARPDDHIFGPIQGTPPGPVPSTTGPPAGISAPSSAPPTDVGAPPLPGPAPGASTPPPDDATSPNAAPSAFAPNRPTGPSVAVASYDPRTGRYTTPDGKREQLKNAVQPAPPESWKDLLTNW